MAIRLYMLKTEIGKRILSFVPPFHFNLLLLKQTLIISSSYFPPLCPSCPLTLIRFLTSPANMPHFITTTGKRCFSLSFSMSLCFFYPPSIIPWFQMFLSPFFNMESKYSISFPSSVFFFSSALPESESQHRNTVITQAENCNSRKICLLFGLVVLNSNELSDSAGKELSLFPVRVICNTRKNENESPAAKRAFSGLSRSWVITEDIAAVISRHSDRYLSSQLMPLQRFHSNPIKYMTNT